MDTNDPKDEDMMLDDCRMLNICASIAKIFIGVVVILFLFAIIWWSMS